ncbi:MAG: c-type cytochrome [Janthinobacterium lividum]
MRAKADAGSAAASHPATEAATPPGGAALPQVVLPPDAPPGSAVALSRAPLSHRARYSWPLQVGPAASRARLDGAASLDAGGKLAHWRYVARASPRDVSRSEGRTDAEVDSRLHPGTHSGLGEPNASDASDASDASVPMQPVMPYGTAHTETLIDDAGGAIPAIAHVFARESLVDEIARDGRRDPLAFRRAHLDPARDGGGVALIDALAQRAVWLPMSLPPRPSGMRVTRGRGMAFDKRAPRPGDTDNPVYSGWIVDLEVDGASGGIAVTRVVAGQARGRIDGSGIEGIGAARIARAAAQLLGRTLAYAPSHDETAGPAALAYRVSGAVGHAVTTAKQTRVKAGGAVADAGPAPAIDAGDTASAAAAIANALYDATGVRFRDPPFTPERVRAVLDEAGQGRRGRFARLREHGFVLDAIRGAIRSAAPVSALYAAPDTAPYAAPDTVVPDATPRRRRRGLAWMAAGAGTLATVLGTAWPIRAPLPLIDRPDPAAWSAATLARGRDIAAAGDCAVCHTAPGGIRNAGGLGIATPFGTVYSTNLTPDVAHGIGGWSFAAFDRAMRQGISRDGRHLYPAFPYTAFTKLSEADMTALYAYLMAQPAVPVPAPATRLRFPFNQRPLLAGWNALYLTPGAYRPEPARAAEWNRGRYLVEGAGHCSACHSPRNALGAEQGGARYLSGGVVDGWTAPSLVADVKSRLPWTEAALFDYLSTGFSPEHGVAAGPMAPVVAGLATLPAADVQAIAHYLASLRVSQEAGRQAPGQVREPTQASTHEQDAPAIRLLGLETGQRIFEGACAVCHADAGGVGNFGVRPLMSRNTGVAERSPDNLLRVIQQGIAAPATDALGYMPGFREAFDDQQIAALGAYLRARFAPGEPAWPDLAATSARIRGTSH